MFQSLTMANWTFLRRWKKSFLYHQKRIANVDRGRRNLINILTVYFVLPLRRRLRLYFFSMRIAFLYQKDSGCFWSTGSHFGYYSWDYGIVSTTVMCVTVCGLFLISFYFGGNRSECVECFQVIRSFWWATIIGQLSTI